ncbi:MAG TPA: ATP-binding protein [Actinomycetota bacterium]|nr:ATP-binding protein [Actinomycetota bacterium]
MIQQRADALRAICKIRWVGLGFAVLQIGTFYTDYPAGYREAALALVAVHAVGNLTIWIKCRKPLGTDAVSEVSFESLILDLFALSGYVAVYTFDPATSIWAILYILPLEGALLYQQRGALSVMAAAGVIYAAREYVGSLVFGYDFLPISIAFTMGIGLIIAAVAGAIASHLENQRDRAIRSEQRLARINDRLTAVLANLPGMAYRARNDERRTLDFVSDGAAALTGYSIEALLSRRVTFCSLIHPEDAARVRTEMQSALQAGAPFQLEYRLVSGDGSEKWVWEQGRSVPGDNGSAIEGLIIDATDRKRLEKELAQAQKMEAVGRLAGGIAHDFNNLLSVVTSYAVLVADDLPEDSPLREDLSEIHKAGQRGASMVRQLLAFSRNQVVAPQVIAIDRVVDDMLNLLRRAVGEHIQITTSLRSGRSVIIDRGQLEQILMNLVVNARDAMPDGGTIRIESCTGAPPGSDSEDKDWVTITVTDTGQGIPPEAMAHIFEPFFTTKEKGGGTGLGLATTYGIIDKAGGRIDISSDVGKGTRVGVYLPAADVQEPVERAAPVPTIEARGEGHIILVVEDEAPVRNVLERMLVKNGHDVLCAASGSEALVHLEDNDVDLMITDVMMPGLSGHGLVQELRERGAEPKVIYISGYDKEVVTSKVHGVSEDDILIQKPFSADDLLDAVSQKLAEATSLS